MSSDATTTRLAHRAAWMPLLAVALVACNDDDNPTPPQVNGNIAEIVANTPAVSTLNAALEAAGLTAALETTGPFTVFAPDNDAFDDLGGDIVTALLEPENEDLLTTILSYHVVPGVAAQSSSLSDGQTATTLQGDAVTIGVSGSTVTVDEATVIDPDVEASNGIIHVIDAVLAPEVDLFDTAILNGFSTLTGVVRDAGLESTVRDDNGGAGYTVFAPTDEALAALPSVPTGAELVSVLTYHVVGATVESSTLTDGQVVTTVDGTRTFTVNVDAGTGAVSITDGSGATVNVVATDVTATNGIIHVIDGVLLPM